MTVEIRVEARVLGDRPGRGIGTVDLALPSERTTAAQLIRAAVEEQVRTLTARRRLTAVEIQRHLARQYATFGGDGDRDFTVSVPDIDVEREVERAIDACRSGRCILVVGGRRVEDLEEEVSLAPETPVQFLRLLPLAGG